MDAGAQNVIFKPAWWHMLVIPALRRWKQEDKEFKADLNYIVRPVSEKQSYSPMGREWRKKGRKLYNLPLKDLPPSSNTPT